MSSHDRVNTRTFEHPKPSRSSRHHRHAIIVPIMNTPIKKYRRRARYIILRSAARLLTLIKLSDVILDNYLENSRPYV